MRLWKILYRSLRLRCPRCGRGRVYAGLRTEGHCPECAVPFAREPGYFLGAIYFNYGLTAMLATIAYPVLVFGGYAAPRTAVAIILPMVIVVPLLFFRHARSLWLGLDELFDPSRLEDGRSSVSTQRRGGREGISRK